MNLSVKKCSRSPCPVCLQVNLSEEESLPSLELAGEWHTDEQHAVVTGMRADPAPGKVWDTAQAMPAAVADRVEGRISTFSEELYRWRVNTQVKGRTPGTVDLA